MAPLSRVMLVYVLLAAPALLNAQVKAEVCGSGCNGLTTSKLVARKLLMDGFTGFTNAITGIGSTARRTIKQDPSSDSNDDIQGPPDVPSDGTGGGAEFIGNTIQGATDAGNAVKDTAVNAGNTVKDAAVDAGNAVKDAASSVGNAFSSFFG